MIIRYNNVDISQKVDVKRLQLFDRYGGMADSVEITFIDTDKEWLDYEAKRGDNIEIEDNNINSGLMYVETIFYSQNQYSMLATSVKPSMKVQRYKLWKKISLHELIKTVAKNLGVEYHLYGVPNYTYESITQNGETDLNMLVRVLNREGCAVKIYDNQLIIFSEAHMIASGKSLALGGSSISSDLKFAQNGSKCASYEVVCYKDNELIQHKAISNTISLGSEIRKIEYVSDYPECVRWAENYLKHENKDYITTSFSKELDNNISACSLLSFSDYGEFNGKYLTYEVVHDLIRKKSIIKARKVG